MSKLPIRRKIDTIQIQFGAILALKGEPARREFHELARAALRLAPNTSPVVEVKPFTLLARRDPDGVIYQLDEASRQRLGAAAISVKMSSDIQYDFGNVLPEVALLLTRLTADELVAAGGARIIDTSSQDEVASWPTRPRHDINLR